MNHIFKIVWNHALCTWVAVSEFAKTQGKKNTLKKSVIAAAVTTLGLGILAHGEIHNSIQDSISTHSVSGIGTKIEGEKGADGKNGALFVKPKGGKPGENVGANLQFINADVNTETGIVILTYKDDKGANVIYQLEPKNKDDLTDYKVYKQEASGNVYLHDTAATVNHTSEGFFTVEIPNYSLEMTFSPEPGKEAQAFAGNKTESLSVSVTNQGYSTSMPSNSTVSNAVIYAVSVGGKGGKGGSYILGGSGRSGGKGGDGGEVNLSVSDQHIDTKGSQIVGIVGQSVGGDAGDGGASYGAINQHGGAGANGGLGGEVHVSVTDTIISMEGTENIGVLGSSVGGNSGDGGKATGFVSQGGKSDTAGAGGDVYITTKDTNINMNGNWSAGIMGQSVGGAGGKGGTSIGLVSLGGQGGAGGNAGKVTIESAGKITVVGENAIGIIGQSLGGGGGNGGGTVGLVSLGSKGAAGGDALGVSITNSGAIQTKGYGGHGILAQAIGGGGGNAGLMVGLVNIGGNGDNGGDAGSVSVNNHDTIIISGENAHGILAQSIGGGGGTGGSQFSGLFTLGASGGKGGIGGAVTLNNTSSIITGDQDSKFNYSSAMIAQSIGGGGGSGSTIVSLGIVGLNLGGEGGTGGNAHAVNVTSEGTEKEQITLQTAGDQSTAIIAQSIGGNGGNAGSVISLTYAPGITPSIAINFGGQGGQGGSSGIAEVVTKYSNINTMGDFSHGIVAQSIGGNGGQGGSIISGAASGLPITINMSGNGGAGAGAQAAIVQTSGGVIWTKGIASSGIIAQSIGGNGGNAGTIVSGSLSQGGTSIGIEIAGNGGKGANSEKAYINNKNDIVTEGSESHALVAQSIGGNGGKGGTSIAGQIGLQSVKVTMSGDGGSGGNSGQAIIKSTGNLVTAKENSTAVVAQSIGGNGGDSGMSIAASLSGLFSFAASISGDGGDGGKSESVFVILGDDDIERKTIQTEGDNSKGVIAQSIGGTGGNVNVAVSGAISIGPEGAASAAVTLGGEGGAGGTAKNVEVATNNQNIYTHGHNSGAILAQSIGGSGGSGGMAISSSLSAATKGPSLSASVAIGGDGGAGGKASTVTVTSKGQLITKGNFSDGIVAQSIGGNGGIGGNAIAVSLSASPKGSAAMSVSVGGKGGTASCAKDVTVHAYESIATEGSFSSGIVAQSIGGSGGKGGLSVAGSMTASGKSAGSISVALGGNGGKGGSAGNVVVNNKAYILTEGIGGSGILAQSIGGNGGAGGSSVSGNITISSDTNVSAQVVIGGKGVEGGQAKKVLVDNMDASIVTKGSLASGIVGQSIGGDGGMGGMAVSGSISISGEGQTITAGAIIAGNGGKGGEAGQVEIISNNQSIMKDEHDKDVATIWTAGSLSHGILAQSIGGTGGQAGGAGNISITASADKGNIDLGIELGGTGGNSNQSNAVDVTSVDNIYTTGMGSSGIYAQSIGGDGGDGGWGFNASVSGSLSQSSNFNANVALGGNGGNGNIAETVTVTSTGIISTAGDHSQGVLAQSIGGSGGNGGMTIDVGLTTKGNNFNIALGGSGGTGHTASAVTITRTGNIYTDGNSSDGIQAQSIGGGGGNGGMSLTGSGALFNSKSFSVSIGGEGGGGGEAGIVTVANAGSIITKGQDSRAILAQSIGGGGGNGGASYAFGANAISTESSWTIAASVGGNGGKSHSSQAVNVENNGVLVTEGSYSQAILAQSIGGGGGNGGLSLTGILNTDGIDKNGKSNTVNIAVGGMGGSSNASGTVTINQIGGIWTKGVGSSGIQAQSIGGGGGNGGNATNDRLTFTCQDDCSSSGKSLGTNLALGIGGWGGTGNKSASVNITNRGNILTEGYAAHGIYAQSIGGGGGDGGNAMFDMQNIDLSNKEIAEDAGISIGIGGYNGAGGEGNSVTIDSIGSISTKGHHAKGILAQSIGGGGGNGGNVEGSLIGIGGGAFQKELSGTVGSFLLDGSKADGSSGDAASVIINTGIFADADKILAEESVIWTQGDKADAIFAQSIGGGGGIGGTAHGELAIGGDGGSGGNGGEIYIKNDSILSTSGRSSSGIVAQSIGGGGGTGAAAEEAKVAVGGSGSNGGHGGKIEIANTKTIYTKGIGSRGIYAQSIGGSGGNGGDALQSTVAIGGGALSSIIGLSSQAHGGNAGEVIIKNQANIKEYMIFTESDLSDALMAQSIGGGGGTGGSADGMLAIGGFAASAGHGNKVAVTNNLILGTQGIQSNGIVAQSIGGGGGIGGGIVANDATTSIIAIGGNGGTAGHGKAVSISNTAELIITEGHLSRGLVAQSIGGGGGIGGYLLTDTTGSDIRDVIMGFGSNVLNKIENGIESFLLNKDAAGGDGDDVVVNNGSNSPINSLIMTKGNGSDAILAQSIGGGGGASGSMTGLFVAGAAGSVVGKAGSVTINNFGQLYTSGTHANGMVAQSIGGGGGIRSGIEAIAKSSILGASDAVKGHADQVSIDNKGLIITENEFSIGILAQSIGGGGAAIGLSELVVLGSASGEINNSAAISVENTGSLSTLKAGSSAIIVQSIGGGGGLAAGAYQVDKVQGKGDSGLITIKNASEYIHTQGAFSHGMIAQSLAGGGGYVNIMDSQQNIISYEAGSSGGSGNSGGVVIEHKGLILTEGLGAYGILAQSQGSQSGDIHINTNSDSSVIGGYGNGAAIMINGGGNNTINNSGLLTSLGTKIAYSLSDQQDENGIWQLIATGWADGSIIQGDMGNNIINNDGYMSGSMYLTGDNQTVTNLEKGWLLAGNSLQLNGVVNNDGLLVNQGKFAVGSMNQVAYTRIDGDFRQDETGIYYWDYDLDRNSKMSIAAQQTDLMAQDRILMDIPTGLIKNALPSIGSYDVLDVTGQAQMNGTLSINVMSPGKATPGVNHQIIVTAHDLKDNGIELFSVPSAVAVFDKIVSKGSFTVRSEIDYSRIGLTQNGHRLGNVINNIQRDQRYADFEPIAAALFYQKDMQTLQAAYDSIMGEGSVGVMQSAFSYSNRMMKIMQKQASDWLTNTRYQNNAALNVDSQQALDATTYQYNDKLRTWLSFDNWYEDISSNTIIGSAAYHSSQNLSALGIDYQVDERTLLGVAVSRGSSNYRMNDRATSGSLRSHGAGLYGIKTFDDTYVKASFGYDYFRASTERFAIIHGTNNTVIPVATVASNLKSKFTGSVANVGVEVGTRFELENNLIISPFVGIQASILKQNNSKEETINSEHLLALNYHKKTAYSIPIFVGAQIDKTFFSPAGALQTYARAALTHEFANRRELTANFIVAPGYDFTMRGAAARRNNVAVDVGFKIMPTKQLEMYGQFNGVYGGKTKKEGFSAGLSYKW